MLQTQAKNFAWVFVFVGEGRFYSYGGAVFG